MRFERFEDIDAWQIARELTRDMYAVSSSGEFARDFGLKDQTRRAAVSIMADIAEGYERGGNREFIQFLSMAKGSVGELRSHIVVATDLKYISDAECTQYRNTCLRLSAMLQGLIRSLRESEYRGHKYADTPPESRNS
jgi:four helix bundle protein